MGLIGTSSNNLIEQNSITGNVNGILIQAGASGNVIRQNIAAGNPPSQVTRLYGPIGFDIKDEASSNGGRNTFERNWCITYGGPGPSPCPNLPGIRPPTISALTATPNAITGVTSNESLDVSDSTLTGPLSVSLRADRNGLGAGRVYSVTVPCTNASQLSATAVVTVAVPHDQR